MLPDQSATEIIEIMLKSGKKGKHPRYSESAPAKHGRKENLTKENIPTIVEAVLNKWRLMPTLRLEVIA